MSVGTVVGGAVGSIVGPLLSISSCTEPIVIFCPKPADTVASNAGEDIADDTLEDHDDTSVAFSAANDTTMLNATVHVTASNSLRRLVELLAEIESSWMLATDTPTELASASLSITSSDAVGAEFEVISNSIEMPLVSFVVGVKVGAAVGTSVGGNVGSDVG